MTTLTLEDLLAAARCVALWQGAGADPRRIARHIRRAAERAERFRREEGRIHPVLGDGTVAAAASALAPSGRRPGGHSRALHDLLPALHAVTEALLRPQPDGDAPDRP